MAHLHYFVAAFAVVLMATASSAMYSKKSGVITLDQNNFDKEVLASDDFFLVEFDRLKSICGQKLYPNLNIVSFEEYSALKIVDWVSFYQPDVDHL